MTKLMVERSFEVGEDQMTEVGKRSKRIALEEFPEIIWHHSHVVVGDDGGFHVHLQSGRVLEADAVVAGLGIVPATEVAEAAGL